MSCFVVNVALQVKEVIEVMEVMQDKVGQIIGSKGAVIKEMQTNSG